MHLGIVDNPHLLYILRAQITPPGKDKISFTARNIWRYTWMSVGERGGSSIPQIFNICFNVHRQIQIQLDLLSEAIRAHFSTKNRQLREKTFVQFKILLLYAKRCFKKGDGDMKWVL